MSQRSAFKTRQRAKEGIVGLRKIDAHILQTRTRRMAELVAISLKTQVAEEVCRELDRRGYPIRAQATVAEGREDFAALVERKSPTDRGPDREVPADGHESRVVHGEDADAAEEVQ